MESIFQSLWRESIKNPEPLSDYFLVAVILMESRNQGPQLRSSAYGGVGGYTRYDVVDGQQRITTFSLLVAAVHYCKTMFLVQDKDDIDKDNISVRYERGNRIGECLPYKLLFEESQDEQMAVIFRRLQNVNETFNTAWERIMSALDMPNLTALQGDEFLQYGKNYVTLCNALVNKLNDMTAKDRMTYLLKFSSYLASHVKVLEVLAPDAAAARNAFTVASTPGEPLDVVTEMKRLLGESLQDEESKDRLLNCFGQSFAGEGEEESERAIVATARAYKSDTEISFDAGPESLVMVIGGVGVGDRLPDDGIAA